MSTQTPTVFLVTILVLGILYFLREEYVKNQKILRQESFYKGKPEDQKRRWSFWQPLFLYRRRRRAQVKKTAVIKHMYQ